MNYPSLNMNFLIALNKLAIKKSSLVPEIIQILNLEKKSVYRRLGGEVPFTTNELGILAIHYNISLDSLISDELHNQNTFRLESPIISPHNGFTQELLEQHISKMKEISNQPESEIGAILNSIPPTLFAQYKNIIKFQLFKWGYYYCGLDSFKHFDTIEVPAPIYDYFIRMNEEFKNIKYAFYIWGNSIIPNLIKDIQYFASIDRISQASIRLLKDELFDSLNKLEELVCLGKHKDTGQKLEFYSSALYLGPSRLYMCSPDFHTTVYAINFIQSLASFEKETAEKARSYTKTIRAASIRISESAEKDRILFFQKQKEMIDLNL